MIIKVIIEITFVKFLLALQTEIHTSPSSPSLTYFQVQLFPVPYKQSFSDPD